MKATKTLGRLIVGCLFTCCLTLKIYGQTNLQFTSIHATVEGAIQPYWASQSNHIYQIQYADSLIDTNTGSTTWNTLYDNYPSHGTNTFILDTGDYLQTPSVVHPKFSPMRFYRILDEGTDVTSFFQAT